MTKRLLRHPSCLLIFFSIFPALESLAAADCPPTAMRWSSTSQRLYVTGDVSCTLSDLDAVTSDTVLKKVSASPSVYLLRGTLYLEKGATLVLHGTAIGGDVDELRLRSNNTSGGYVYIRGDVGNLDIDTTKITSWDEATGAPDTEYATYGRAYIHVRSRLDADGVTAHEARMDIRHSDIGYLGFDASESYGLAWKVYGSGTGLYDKVDVLGDILDSRIHHNYFGGYTYGAYGMNVIGNEFDNNVKYGFDPHDDSDHLVIEDNDIHDNGNHGWICSQRCNDLEVRNNRSYDNVGNGFMIHRNVVSSILEGNEAWGNTDSGLAIFDSHGNTVRNNYFHDQLRGIRFSVGSSDNLIEDNVLERNGIGLYFFRSPNDAPTSGDGHPRRNTVIGNTVKNNVKAIKASESDENQFIDNVFSGMSDPEPFYFADGVGNVLSGNTIPSTALIHTKTSALAAASTTITDAPGQLYIDVSGAAKTTFVETALTTHWLSGSTKATSVTPDGGTLTLTSMSPAIVNAAPIYGTPSSGTLLVTPSGATTFKARAESGTLTATFTVGKLTPATVYKVTRDGAAWKQVTSSASGVVTFDDQVDTTTRSYAVGL